MRRIDEIRWMMNYDEDPIQDESIRLTKEIFKTLAVCVFGLLVLGVMA